MVAIRYSIRMIVVEPISYCKIEESLFV